MANQNAVEWLIETLSNKHIGFEIYVNSNKEIIEQANQMFKEQIIETWKHGNLPTFLGRVLTAEEYYKETYGK